MLRAAVLSCFVAQVLAECDKRDAICRDQELPSNSLLQRDKRALGKELSEERTETVQEAKVRIAKELDSDNFTITLGGCENNGDKSCCFSRGITCTNPPDPFKAAETGCPLGAICSAPLSVPFGVRSYGVCQCQGGSTCEGGTSCGMPSFPFNPFGEDKTKESKVPKEKSTKSMAAVESSVKEDAAVKIETVQEARVRIAKELNSDNFSISLGGCDPGILGIGSSGDQSCCFARGLTCTNPPNPMKAFETGCPLGALCTAPLSVNIFGPPVYGYCQCQGGSVCNGDSCAVNFPNPFGEAPSKEPKQAMAETQVKSEESTRFLGGCQPGTKDAACCMQRGLTCTNPPNPFESSTFCPEGAVCTAALNVNPFAGPQYGYCKCAASSCATDGNSCGGKIDIPDPFTKCTGALNDPKTCCPKRYTCTNPPSLTNLSTACGMGQACDADPTLMGGQPQFGTCKCIAGTCGAEGNCV